MSSTTFLLAFVLLVVFVLAGRSLQMQRDLNQMIAAVDEIEEDLTLAEDQIGAMLLELEAVGIHVDLNDFVGYVPVWEGEEHAA